jgi:hypothetical protein
MEKNNKEKRSARTIPLQTGSGLRELLTGCTGEINC